MNQIRILSVLPVEDRYKEYLMQQTEGHDVNVAWSSYETVTPELVSGADIIIGNIAPDILRKANDDSLIRNNAPIPLKWLQLNSAGADAYTADRVLPETTILTSSSGAYGTSVSEHLLAMTISLVRRFDQYARQQTLHVWKPAGKVTSIRNSTVLVLGLGDIGSRYAEMMHALGARVIGVRRTVHTDKPDYLEEQHVIGDLDGLLPQADIVAMILPGGAATEHIMDERRIRLMKKGAFLINDGRGNAVDLTALKKVLKEGRLGGAGLDVTEPEPLPYDDELWDMEHVIITPHIAGQFLLQETFENVVKIAGENLHAYLNDEPLQHLVNRKRGY